MRVHGRETLQRVIQRHDVDVAGAGRQSLLDERNVLPAGAAFLGGMRPRVIDEDPAHDLRGNAKKVRPIAPPYFTLIDQAQVGFVDERGGLQRVSNRLVSKIARGEAAEFAVHERQQLLDCLTIAFGAEG